MKIALTINLLVVLQLLRGSNASSDDSNNKAHHSSEIALGSAKGDSGRFLRGTSEEENDMSITSDNLVEEGGLAVPHRRDLLLSQLIGSSFMGSCDDKDAVLGTGVSLAQGLIDLNVADDVKKGASNMWTLTAGKALAATMMLEVGLTIFGMACEDDSESQMISLILDTVREAGFMTQNQYNDMELGTIQAQLRALFYWQASIRTWEMSDFYSFSSTAQLLEYELYQVGSWKALPAVVMISEMKLGALHAAAAASSDNPEAHQEALFRLNRGSCPTRGFIDHARNAGVAYEKLPCTVDSTGGGSTTGTCQDGKSAYYSQPSYTVKCNLKWLFDDSIIEVKRHFHPYCHCPPGPSSSCNYMCCNSHTIEAMKAETRVDQQNKINERVPHIFTENVLKVEELVHGLCPSSILLGWTGSLFHLSGVYVESNDKIGGQPIWDERTNNYIAYYCQSNRKWVVTEAIYRPHLLNENGGGCGGATHSFAHAEGGSAALIDSSWYDEKPVSVSTVPAWNNYLLKGKASQSSLFPNSEAYAELAVDGLKNQGGTPSPVTHTQNGAVEWWKLDLFAVADVTSVTVWNRADCCQSRLNGASVQLLDGENNILDSKSVGDNISEQTLKFWPMVKDVHAVKISLEGKYEFLSLAEVEVHGEYAAEE